MGSGGGNARVDTARGGGRRHQVGSPWSDPSGTAVVHCEVEEEAAAAAAADERFARTDQLSSSSPLPLQKEEEEEDRTVG